MGVCLDTIFRGVLDLALAIGFFTLRCFLFLRLMISAIVLIPFLLVDSFAGENGRKHGVWYERNERRCKLADLLINAIEV